MKCKTLKVGDYISLKKDVLEEVFRLVPKNLFRVKHVEKGFFEAQLRTWHYDHIDQVFTKETNPEYYL